MCYVRANQSKTNTSSMQGTDTLSHETIGRNSSHGNIASNKIAIPESTENMKGTDCDLQKSRGKNLCIPNRDWSDRINTIMIMCGEVNIKFLYISMTINRSALLKCLTFIRENYV